MDNAKRADELRRRLLVLADSAEVFRSMATSMDCGSMQAAVNAMGPNVSPAVIASCAVQLMLVGLDGRCENTVGLSRTMMQLAIVREARDREAVVQS